MAGEKAPTGGSRDIPIVVADSSPISSPTSVKTKLPPPAPKFLFSIFAPRKQAADPSPSTSYYGKPSTKPPVPTAPYPDHENQHVRGPQATPSTYLSQFSRRERSGKNRETAIDIAADPPAASNPFKRPSDARTVYPTPFDVLDPRDMSTRRACLASIPTHHRQYPAIGRVLEAQQRTRTRSNNQVNGSEGLLWNDKWRPKRAEEVLGNEQSALYLRDWLLSLKLHIHGPSEASTSNPTTSDNKGKQKSKKAKDPRGAKRPRIVRDVQRKRRRVESEEPEGTWSADDRTDDEPHLDLVFTDGEDPLNIIDTVDENDFTHPRLSRLRHADTGETSDGSDPPVDDEQTSSLTPSDNVPPFAYEPAQFGDTIYNTILLAGPPGCGKTASVYACAEELGWDVFEVYPGIGERSGSALQKLIGDVGKNHLVRQTQHPPKDQAKAKAQAKANFFAKRVVSDDEEPSRNTQDTKTDQDRTGSATPETTAAEISQSIVLIEEVDILFREDTNFWPTLTRIIKECRRPVVLTCSGTFPCYVILSSRPLTWLLDIGLVPTRDLPLQCILHLRPCVVPLAASYLRAMSLSENVLLDVQTGVDLFEGSRNPLELRERNADESLHPHSIPQAQPDLRRAINQLQLGIGAYVGDEEEVPCGNTDERSLRKLSRIAWSIELCSFADYGLLRPKEEVLRVSPLTHYVRAVIHGYLRTYS